MRISPKTRASFAGIAFASLAVLVPAAVHAQGCVAAHSPQPIIAGLNPTAQFGSHSFANGQWLHNLTLTTGFRTYNSFRHYVGTVEQKQREINKNAVVNHVDLFELDINYQFTPRVSFVA